MSHSLLGKTNSGTMSVHCGLYNCRSSYNRNSDYEVHRCFGGHQLRNVDVVLMAGTFSYLRQVIGYDFLRRIRREGWIWPCFSYVAEREVLRTSQEVQGCLQLVQTGITGFQFELGVDLQTDG
jgi:hypothetical protein